MTGLEQPVVTVHYTDRALTTLAMHLARTTQGVTRLQPQLARRAAAVARNTLGGPYHPDASAVSISREEATITVSVRLAIKLDPPPLRTLDAVAARINDAITAVTGCPTVTSLTVIDIEPPTSDLTLAIPAE